jgi:acetoin utilization deacetylase AcuC-like enzyme
MTKVKKILNLFREDLVVVNLGLDTFADTLRKEQVKVIQMNWRPPAGGNQSLIALLDKLEK